MENTPKQSFLFVINPVAGGVDKSIVKNAIHEWSNKNEVSAEVYETKGKDDARKVAERIKENNQILVAVGGDGTLKIVAEAVIQSAIGKVSLIPAGSANGMAKELGIESVNFSIEWIAENQLNQLLQNLLNGTTTKMDVVQLNNEYMLHLADFGVNAKLIRDFDEESERGFSSYARNALKNLVEREKFAFTVRTENAVIERSGYMLAIANASRYGTGAIINPKGSLYDGSVELVSVKELAWSSVLSSLISILTDDVEYNSEDIEFNAVQRAEIQLDQKVPFQIDGEYMGLEDRINVTCIPGHLELWLPS